MDKKRILIVTQELSPYVLENTIADLVNGLAVGGYKKGMDIRILMPRYGSINERRHRLHEVVRLSGINIIIEDDDYPLIIKVASLPSARLQVYFLDNEDFFSRKSNFTKEDGTLFDDSAERIVFFCRGVLETVRKFGWPPDVVHCHGWMTSLIPAFIRTAYKKDPIFENSQLVYSLYNDGFDGVLPENLLVKAKINRVKVEDLEPFGEATFLDLQKGAMNYSDALIIGTENLSEELSGAIDAVDKPKLAYPGEEFLDSYIEFYNSLIEEEEAEEEATVETK